MSYTRYITRTRPSIDTPFAQEVYDFSYVLTDFTEMGVLSSATFSENGLSITWTHVCDDYQSFAAYKQYVYTSEANTLTDEYDAEHGIITTFAYDSPETELLWDSIPVETA